MSGVEFRHPNLPVVSLLLINCGLSTKLTDIRAQITRSLKTPSSVISILAAYQEAGAVRRTSQLWELAVMFNTRASDS